MAQFLLKAFAHLVDQRIGCQGRFQSKPGAYVRKPSPTENIPTEVLLEIFRFATYVHEAATVAPLDPWTPGALNRQVFATNTPVLSMRTKRHLVLVCRAWHTVATPLLYEHISIPSPRRATQILNSLLESARRAKESHSKNGAEHGYWVRCITIETFTRGSQSMAYLQTLFRIFQLSPHLQHLRGTWRELLPEEFRQAVTRLYGDRLKGLYWNSSHSNAPGNPFTFLASFTVLRILDLRYIAQPDADLDSRPQSRPVLPNVSELILSKNKAPLTVATTLLLPKLERLTLAEGTADVSLIKTFLNHHGSSLCYVSLVHPDDKLQASTSGSRLIPPSIFLQPGACPRLHTLIFNHRSPLIEDLSESHPTLRRIGLSGVQSAYLHPKPSIPNTESNTKDHLYSFSLSNFPNLEVVRLVGFLLHADAEGLVKNTRLTSKVLVLSSLERWYRFDHLAQDFVLWWSEYFEEIGVDFQDGQGVLWLWEPEPEGGAPQEGAEEKKPEAKVVEEPMTFAFPPEIQQELKSLALNGFGQQHGL